MLKSELTEHMAGKLYMAPGATAEKSELMEPVGQHSVEKNTITVEETL